MKQTVYWKHPRSDGRLLVEAAHPKEAAEHVADLLALFISDFTLAVWQGEFTVRPIFGPPDYEIGNG